MLLQDFFEALTNQAAVVTVKDASGNELVKVNAAGYAQLLASLLAETVAQITVVNTNAVTVVLDGVSA